MTEDFASGRMDEYTKEYTYNKRNQLIGYSKDNEEVSSYTYYADGLRRSKTVGDNTTYFYYDRGNIVAEGDGTNITAQNGFGPQGIIRRKVGTDTTYYFKDAHGDVKQTIDGTTSEVTQSYTYDAYGNEADPSATDTNPFRYCGEYYDEESELIYLRNRYYDPSTQRFITEDPAKDGMNWYAYCGGNPVNFWDPTGYITEDEIAMYENGEMAPMAYTHLMWLTYCWYFVDTQEMKDFFHGLAEDFRATGYTTTYGLFPEVDEGIEYMSKKPSDGEISEEEHYFRNELNIEFSWEDFQALQSKLPDNLKWKELDWYESVFHKFSFDTPWQAHNRKYVSSCEHFEVVYTKENYLVNESFSSEYMGTYNYYGPTQADKHREYDVDPYFDYGNVR